MGYSLAPTAHVPRPPPGMLSIPRALAQAIQIRKGEVLEWRLEGGRLVLLRLQRK